MEPKDLTTGKMQYMINNGFGKFSDQTVPSTSRLLGSHAVNNKIPEHAISNIRMYDFMCKLLPLSSPMLNFQSLLFTLLTC